MNDKQRMAREEMRRRATERFNEKYYGKETEDTREKRSLALFFDIFFRNVGTFFWMNLLYLLCYGPILACVFFLSRLLTGSDMEASDFQMMPVFIYVPLILGIFLGPFTSAMTYIHRKLLTRKHVFFWSDFWEQFRKNFKQSWFFGILDTLCTMAIGVMVPFVRQLFTEGQVPLKLVVILGIFALVLFLYFSVRQYVYLQIVTIRLSLGGIVRNALYLAVLGIKNNVISFLIFAASVIVTLLAVPWTLILTVTVECSLLWFVCVWFGYKKLYELLVAPELERMEKLRQSGEAPDDEEFSEFNLD